MTFDFCDLLYKNMLVNCPRAECVCYKRTFYTRIGLKPSWHVVTIFARADPLSLGQHGMYRDVRMVIYGMLSRSDIYACMLACDCAPTWRMCMAAVAERHPIAQWIRDRIYIGRKKHRRVAVEAAKFGVVPRVATSACNEQLVAWGHMHPDALYEQARTPSMEHIPRASVHSGNISEQSSPLYVLRAAYELDRADIVSAINYPKQAALAFSFHAIKCADMCGMMTYDNAPLALGYGNAQIINACVATSNTRYIMQCVVPNSLPIVQWVYKKYGCVPSDIMLEDWLFSKRIDCVRWGISQGATVEWRHVPAAMRTRDIGIVEMIYAACKRTLAIPDTVQWCMQSIIDHDTTRAIASWYERVIARNCAW